MVQEIGSPSGRNNTDRRRMLLRLLAERGYLTVKEASEQLAVSEVTVRQDFATLEREGLLQRRWGGAALPEPGRKEGTFAARLEMQKSEKSAIAAAALELIEEGDTLLLDASTTAFALAQRLKDYRGELQVITNGLYAALELASNPKLTVVTLGGLVRGSTGSLVGTLGEEVLTRLHATKGFFSAHGCSLQQGLSESNLQESQLKSLMVEHTGQVIALIDDTKLGRSSFATFCPYDRLDRLITAGPQAHELVEPFVERGLDVTIAQGQ